MKKRLKVHAMIRTAFVAEVEVDVPAEVGVDDIHDAVSALANVEWKLDGTPEYEGTPGARPREDDDEVYEFEELD